MLAQEAWWVDAVGAGVVDSHSCHWDYYDFGFVGALEGEHGLGHRSYSSTVSLLLVPKLAADMDDWAV